MKEIKFKWTGIRPLVMSNPQTVNVINPHSVAGREINTKLKAARKKQDESKLVELELKARQNDFAGSAYWDDEGFYVPDTSILACIKESARAQKKGKDIDRAVIISEAFPRVDCGKRFKSIEAAFEDDNFRLECPCKIPPKTGALLWKCRCMIPTGWSINFTVEYDDDILTAKTLEEIGTNAGRMVGIGGWRPKFGRFISEIV